MPREKRQIKTTTGAEALLKTAIKIGEQQTDDKIRLANKMNKLLYYLHTVRSMLNSGRPSEAATYVEYCIKLIQDEARR
jgi:hypothetical protein